MFRKIPFVTAIDGEFNWKIEKGGYLWLWVELSRARAIWQD